MKFGSTTGVLAPVVAPCAGAGIEMELAMFIPSASASPPARGRGLKSIARVSAKVGVGRPLRGGGD